MVCLLAALQCACSLIRKDRTRAWAEIIRRTIGKNLPHGSADELVARHVLGWGERRISGTEHVPPFSTDIAAAWQVVDAYPNLRFSLERFETKGSSTASIEGIEPKFKHSSGQNYGQISGISGAIHMIVTEASSMMVASALRHGHLSSRYAIQFLQLACKDPSSPESVSG